jgi:hypothetical protein
MEPYLNPTIGPVTALVYHAKPADVDMVMVAGEVIYSEGRFTRFDADDARAKLGEYMTAVYHSQEYAGSAIPAELMARIRKYYEDWPIPELDPVYVVNSRR